MKDQCERTIAPEDDGGELHLDSSKMSSRIGKCTVYIKAPRRYQDVMFYFTDFSVGVSDTRTNVTIRGQYRTRIRGNMNDNNIKNFKRSINIFYKLYN